MSRSILVKFVVPAAIASLMLASLEAPVHAADTKPAAHKCVGSAQVVNCVLTKPIMSFMVTAQVQGRTTPNKAWQLLEKGRGDVTVRVKCGTHPLYFMMKVTGFNALGPAGLNPALPGLLGRSSRCGIQVTGTARAYRQGVETRVSYKVTQMPLPKA